MATESTRFHAGSGAEGDPCTEARARQDQPFDRSLFDQEPGSGLHGPRGWGLEVEDVRISGGVTHARVVETKDECAASGEFPSCSDPHAVPMASIARSTRHQDDPEIGGLSRRDRNDPPELLAGRYPQGHVDDPIDRREPVGSIDRRRTHIVLPTQSSVDPPTSSNKRACVARCPPMGTPRPNSRCPGLSTSVSEGSTPRAARAARALSTSRRIRGLITTSWTRGGMGSARSTASGSSCASM